jgi:hypothetical protein
LRTASTRNRLAPSTTLHLLHITPQQTGRTFRIVRNKRGDDSAYYILARETP